MRRLLRRIRRRPTRRTWTIEIVGDFDLEPRFRWPTAPACSAATPYDWRERGDLR